MVTGIYVGKGTYALSILNTYMSAIYDSGFSLENEIMHIMRRKHDGFHEHR